MPAQIRLFEEDASTKQIPPSEPGKLLVDSTEKSCSRGESDSDWSGAISIARLLSVLLNTVEVIRSANTATMNPIKWMTAIAGIIVAVLVLRNLVTFATRPIKLIKRRQR